MFDSIPTRYQDVKDWTWAQFQPLVDDLLALPLDADNIESWLSGWTQLNDLYDEIGNRAYVETSVDTTDEAAQARFEYYNNYMQPEFMRAEHQLNQKLVESGLLPAGMEIAVRRIRNGIELFRDLGRIRVNVAGDEDSVLREGSGHHLGTESGERSYLQHTLRSGCPYEGLEKGALYRPGEHLGDAHVLIGVVGELLEVVGQGGRVVDGVPFDVLGDES